MKKCILFFLTITITTNLFISLCAFSSDNISFDSHNTSSPNVSRCDCLCFVMLAIGSKSYHYPDTEKTVVCEYDEKLLGEEKVKKAYDYYSNNCMFKEKRDLVHAGVAYLKIANGEYKIGKNNEYVFFNTYRNATVNEAVAFMVRCLEKDKAVSKTLDEIFEIAKEKGLILESDYFYDLPNEELTLDILRRILTRFLDMPRGWYHSNGDYDLFSQYTLFDFDGTGNTTYRENLVERYTENFVEKLLLYDASVQWTPGDREIFLEIRESQKSEK